MSTPYPEMEGPSGKAQGQPAPRRIVVAGAAPIGKVSAAGTAGAVAVIVVWALRQFAGVELPVEVAAALTVLLTVGTAYLKK